MDFWFTFKYKTVEMFSQPFLIFNGLSHYARLTGSAPNALVCGLDLTAICFAATIISDPIAFGRGAYNLWLSYAYKYYITII